MVERMTGRKVHNIVTHCERRENLIQGLGGTVDEWCRQPAPSDLAVATANFLQKPKPLDLDLYLKIPCPPGWSVDSGVSHNLQFSQAWFTNCPKFLSPFLPKADCRLSILLCGWIEVVCLFLLPKHKKLRRIESVLFTDGQLFPD